MIIDRSVSVESYSDKHTNDDKDAVLPPKAAKISMVTTKSASKYGKVMPQTTKNSNRVPSMSFNTAFGKTIGMQSIALKQQPKMKIQNSIYL